MGLAEMGGSTSWPGVKRSGLAWPASLVSAERGDPAEVSALGARLQRHEEASAVESEGLFGWRQQAEEDRRRIRREYVGRAANAAIWGELDKWAQWKAADPGPTALAPFTGGQTQANEAARSWKALWEGGAPWEPRPQGSLPAVTHPWPGGPCPLIGRRRGGQAALYWVSSVHLCAVWLSVRKQDLRQWSKEPRSSSPVDGNGQVLLLSWAAASATG